MSSYALRDLLVSTSIPTVAANTTDILQTVIHQGMIVGLIFKGAGILNAAAAASAQTLISPVWTIL